MSYDQQTSIPLVGPGAGSHSPHHQQCKTSATVHRGAARPHVAGLRGWIVAVLLGAAACASAQTWTQPTSNTGDDLLDVVFSTAATAAAVGLNSATVVSGDAGSTWADETLPLPGGADLNAVFSNGQTIVAVGDDGPGGGNPESITASPDNGSTWAQITNVPGINENLIDGLFVNATNAVAVETQGGAGEVLLSVDRGASWTNPFTALAPLNAVDSRGALVIAVGSNQIPTETIVRSTTSGTGWAAANTVPGATIDLFAVHIVSSSIAVAVGSNGDVVRSTNAGDDWVQPASPAAADLNAVDGLGVFLVAVGDGGTIIRSIDSGATWAVPTTNPAAQNLNDVQFLSGSVMLAVGDNGEILGSTDRGDTWALQASGTGEDLVRLGFNGINNTLAVGTNGTILLSRDQIQVTEPIPFRSKGWLLALLLGAGLWTLWRRRALR